MRLNDRVHTDNHPASYYSATLNDDRCYAALEGNTDVDICIVGGGLTGLSAAIHALEKGYKVALIEQCRIGWGASGRNGGQVLGGFGERGQSLIEKKYGEEIGQSVWDMGVECVDIIRGLVAKYAIDCDLTWGYFDAAIKHSDLADLEKSKAELESRGYQHRQRIVGAEEVRDFIGSDRYVGGLSNDGWGHVHVLNLCVGEARAIEGLGGHIYEGSEVTKIEFANRPVAHTANGSVSADFLVLCGNAYMGNLAPKLSSTILPAGSYIIATEQLGETLANELMPTNAAACDQRWALDYFRLSADNRLIFGGMATYSGRHPKDIFATMRPRMLKVFPQLAEKKIEFAWGGNMGIGLNRIPQLGRLSDNVYFAQAYSGHGVAQTHMASRLIVETIAGQAERFDIFSGIRHLPFPGGRLLRQPTLAAAMLYMKLRDEIGI